MRLYQMKRPVAQHLSIQLDEYDQSLWMCAVVAINENNVIHLEHINITTNTPKQQNHNIKTSNR